MPSRMSISFTLPNSGEIAIFRRRLGSRMKITKRSVQFIKLFSANFFPTVVGGKDIKRLRRSLAAKALVEIFGSGGIGFEIGEGGIGVGIFSIDGLVCRAQGRYNLHNWKDGVSCYLTQGEHDFEMGGLLFKISVQKLDEEKD